MFSSRKHAEQLLGYFTRMADEHGRAESYDGIDCAREWIAMIDSDTVPPDRIAALRDRIDARTDGGCAWIDLQLGFGAWVRRSRGG